MEERSYMRGFLPYALCALLIGVVGGFSTVLGPAFMLDRGLDYGNTTWTALAQAISTAAGAPVLGKLGDRIGRRAALIAGLVVFTAGNAITSAADSLAVMIAARFIVGAGTAAMAPVIMAYIVSEFPKSEMARGFSLYMLISSASVIIGPSLGGVIIAAWGWRSMIRICVALCLAVLPACLYLSRQERDTGGRIGNFDIPGAVIVPVFFALVLCIPAFGQNVGWTTPAFAAIAMAAAIALGLLIFWEKRAKDPILPGTFMARKAFVLPVLALFLTQGLMQANMTNTIVFVNSVHGGNSALSGYAISVMYIGMSLGAVLLGPLADRFEPKRVLTGSLALTGAGCALMALYSPQTPLWLMMASLGALGAGLGGNGTIFMKVALYGVAPEAAGAGTGTYGLFRDLAAPFGVAVFVPMFTNGVAARISAGTDAARAAAVQMKHLALVEILCIAAGIVVVMLLPEIRQGREKNHAIEG